MAQTTDYEIANSSGLVFRGRVNEVLAAVQSSNSGATAPTDTAAGMLWFDTSVTPAILRRRNAADSAWIDVYSTEDLASQAEAEAGTNNTKLMTPLRVAQAIDAQVPAAEGMTLLGTLTTTSGTTQTLSGLNLTSYKELVCYIRNVSHNSGTSQNLRINLRTCSSTIQSGNIFGWGVVRLSLLDGTGFGIVDDFSGSEGEANQNTRIFTSSVTTANTSVSFTWALGASFDLGSILVYGVN